MVVGLQRSRPALRLIALSMTYALLWASGCYEDLKVSESAHPCSSCKPCEVCSIDGTTVFCTNPLSLACKDGDVHQIAACGEDLGLQFECMHGTCKEESSIGSCRCEGGWAGDSCDVCPPHWDAENDCATCMDGWQGDTCEDCEYPWLGTWCNICAGNLSKESDCTECMTGYKGVENACVQCDDGWERDVNQLCVQVCGNAIVTQDEQCDDGNDEPGDGCDACKIVPNTLTRASTILTDLDSVDMAASGEGHAVFVQTRYLNSAATYRGYLNFVLSDGTLSPTIAVFDGAGHQLHAHVAMDADGHAIVAWQQPDSDGYESLHVRRFYAAGKAIAAPFKMVLPQKALVRDVSANETGEFVVVWSVDGLEPEAQQFDDHGKRVGGVVKAIHATTVDQPITAAMRADGTFAILYVRTEQGHEGQLAGTNFPGGGEYGSAIKDFGEPDLPFKATVGPEGKLLIGMRDADGSVHLRLNHGSDLALPSGLGLVNAFDISTPQGKAYEIVWSDGGEQLRVGFGSGTNVSEFAAITYSTAVSTLGGYQCFIERLSDTEVLVAWSYGTETFQAQRYSRQGVTLGLLSE